MPHATVEISTTTSSTIGSWSDLSKAIREFKRVPSPNLDHLGIIFGINRPWYFADVAASKPTQV